jgi:hypothetical protein
MHTANGTSVSVDVMYVLLFTQTVTTIYVYYLINMVEKTGFIPSFMEIDFA